MARRSAAALLAGLIAAAEGLMAEGKKWSAGKILGLLAIWPLPLAYLVLGVAFKDWSPLKKVIVVGATCVAVFAVVALFGAVEERYRLNTLLESARSLAAAGDVAGAEGAFKRAWTLQPLSLEDRAVYASVLRSKAKALDVAGDLRGAAATLESALRLAPKMSGLIEERDAAAGRLAAMDKELARKQAAARLSDWIACTDGSLDSAAAAIQRTGAEAIALVVEADRCLTGIKGATPDDPRIPRWSERLNDLTTMADRVATRDLRVHAEMKEALWLPANATRDEEAVIAPIARRYRISPDKALAIYTAVEVQVEREFSALRPRIEAALRGRLSGELLDIKTDATTYTVVAHLMATTGAFDDAALRRAIEQDAWTTIDAAFALPTVAEVQVWTTGHAYDGDTSERTDTKVFQVAATRATFEGMRRLSTAEARLATAKPWYHMALRSR